MPQSQNQTPPHCPTDSILINTLISAHSAILHRLGLYPQVWAQVLPSAKPLSSRKHIENVHKQQQITSEAADKRHAPFAAAVTLVKCLLSPRRQRSVAKPPKPPKPASMGANWPNIFPARDMAASTDSSQEEGDKQKHVSGSSIVRRRVSSSGTGGSKKKFGASSARQQQQHQQGQLARSPLGLGVVVATSLYCGVKAGIQVRVVFRCEGEVCESVRE